MTQCEAFQPVRKLSMNTSRKRQRKNLLHRISVKLKVRPSLLLPLLISTSLSVLLTLVAWSGPSSRQRSVCAVQSCLNVLVAAASGEWMPATSVNSTSNHLLGLKLEDIDDIKKRFNFPLKMFRDDLRCGPAHLLTGSTLAAECDPHGEHPCCNQATGWCGSTVYHCHGQSTKDYAHNGDNVPRGLMWKPHSESCDMMYFDRYEACNVLARTTSRLVFLGDGNARNMFTTFVLFLTNSFTHGALKPNASKEILQKCYGEYQVLDYDCHTHLISSSLEPLHAEICPEVRQLFLQYIPDFELYLAPSTQSKLNEMRGRLGTYVILDNGYHFDSNHNHYLRHFLEPLRGHLHLSELDWPKLIVNTLPDAQGASRYRKDFNNRIKDVCVHHGIPLLDCFEASVRLPTYDGRSYGLDLNLLKMHIILQKLGMDCTSE